LIRRTVGEIERAGKARIEPVPRALVEPVARDRHFATLYALRATDRLFRAAGSQALFEGNELQRRLRDVHAVASRTTRLGAIAAPAGATEVLVRSCANVTARKTADIRGQKTQVVFS